MLSLSAATSVRSINELLQGCLSRLPQDSQAVQAVVQLLAHEGVEQLNLLASHQRLDH